MEIHLKTKGPTFKPPGDWPKGHEFNPCRNWTEVEQVLAEAEQKTRDTNGPQPRR